jgi:Chitobiase/beta-hexosaminidase C-terminal domain/FG-GAP-like repeat
MNVCTVTASGGRASRPSLRSSKRQIFGALSFMLALACGCGVSGITNFSGPQTGSSATATPVISPASGTSGTTSISVTIADTTPSATIFYTSDGSAPSPSATLYTGAITVTSNTTIKSMAMAKGYEPSGIASASYIVNAAETAAATPAISPASGTSFASNLSVSITDSTTGATIYYTTDGSTPTASSTVYSAPFTISASTKVQAIATASGYQASAVASSSYTLSAPETATATPVISPASGTSFSSSLSVSIADSTAGATIYYTTNGSTPTTSSSVYSGPITLNASTTVQAIAVASGYQPSAVAGAAYTLNVVQSAAATPMISPASGTTFASSLSVSIVDSTPGATIYYTTNGSVPTTSSSVYAGPITITANTTVNAIATASGYTQSAVASAAYTLQSPAATPIISPASGTSFASSLSVSIADPTPGATVYYTTNGSMPTTSSSVYAGPITITAATTVKAIATASGYSQSAVASAAYTLQSQTAAPVISPASGTSFANSLSVTIADSTPGAIIYYTTNGSVATTGSSVYSGPITITNTTTINAIAVATGYTQSADSSISYTLQSPAATPVFSPASGTSFANSLSVSIADSTPNATIYYTTNGSTPTTSSGVYSGPITITAATTVKAIATASGFTQSAVGSASYALQSPAATPVLSPVSGTSFANSLSVSIADSTPGATIYYTTNGSAPTTSSSVYSGPISITATTTVNAIATASGFTQSAVGTASYTLQSPAATPVFSPVSGTSFANSLSVSIADSTPGATIYYTTNGSTPTTSSTVYSGPVTITANTTVKAIATASGFAQSAVGTASYTLQSPAATPTFSPASGTTFATSLSVSIADSTPGATIYYTTNGSAPTTSSSVYSGPITITATTTVNAIATASGFTQSAVGSASYTLQTVAATPTFNPASGTTFTSTLSVSLADTTSGATIYYTTNGSTPTTSSAVYSGPISISATTTIEAIAGGTGFTSSGVASATYTMTTGNAGVVSDNLDEAALNTSLWTLENPLGDGTVVMTGSGANLNVPMGQNHDLTTAGNNSVRIMQPISNSDFSVDARFQSAVEIGDQDEGILVEQDAGDFLRFDVLFNASTGAPELFAEGVSGANATTFIDTPFALPQGPLVLRLARTANVWTGSWSTDGTNFTSMPGFTFDLNAAKVGPYAGAANTTPSNSPAFTATVDYFFATSDPIANHDGPKPYGWVTVDANPASTLVEKTLADIQGTGHLEPVIGLERESQGGNTGVSGVYWYGYPASGNVHDKWIRHTIIGSGDGYEDMLAFDVNGDGAVDIICSFDPTFSGDPEVVWFENPRGSGGNPITNTWTMHVIGPGLGENNLLVKDIDGDGKMDVVSPSSVYFQNSPTSWTQVQYSQSFRGVALLDIGSGKGAINLAGTQPASPYNMVWWENPRETGGNARTGTWIMHYIGPPYPCSPDNCSTASGSGEVAAFNAADVNGDGKMDVISGQSEGPGGGIAPPPGGMIWWQAPSDRRTGAWIKHTMDVTMIDVHKIQVADMDNNGTLDIMVAEQDQSPLNRVAVFYNDGKGNLTEQIISNAKGHNDDIGDVIGNGALDILNSGHGFFNDSHPLQIFLNPY